MPRDRPIQKQQAIARVMAGEEQAKVARDLGVHPMTVCGWMKEPEVKAEWERVKEQAKEHSKNTVEQARKLLQDKVLDVAAALLAKAIDGDTRACVEVLNRTGLDVTQKTELSGKLEGIEGKSDTELREYLLALAAGLAGKEQGEEKGAN